MLAQARSARAVADEVRRAVYARGAALTRSRKEVAAARWSADQNVRSIELLPALLERALEERPAERQQTLAQAAEIVRDTRESSSRLAAWADRDDLAELIASVWRELERLLMALAGAAGGVAALLLVVLLLVVLAK